jgi:hypothetical protein
VDPEKGFEEVVFGAVCPPVAVDKVVLPFPGREDKRVPPGHHLLLDPQFVIPENNAMVPREIDA